MIEEARLLVVDDDELLLDNMSDYLTDSGYHVTCANCGEEALEKFEEASPDAVLLDLMMPGMSGFELLAELKKINSNLPLVVISGRGETSVALKAIREGAWDYLVKPVDRLELINHTLTRVIEKAKLIAENRQYRQNLEELVQRRTEQLRQSEEKFRLVFENSNDAIFWLDSESRLIINCNRAGEKLLHQSLNEIIGVSPGKFLPSGRAESFNERLQKHFDTGGLLDVDSELLTADGKIVPVWVSTSLVELGQYRILQMIVHDVTERRLAEQQERLHHRQLQQADKMVALGTLVAGVAHEINNPNNFIRLNGLILRDLLTDLTPVLDEYKRQHGDFKLGAYTYSEFRDELPSVFESILEGARRIENIVSDLKKFSKSSDEDDFSTLEINTVVETSVNLMNNMIKKSTQHFTLELGKKIPKVSGNFQQLEQVIINLLQNACQALPDMNASMSCRTGFNKKSKRVFIEVNDEGSGIDPKNMERIFDPFFTTKRDTGGTGLGLSVSARIISEHGGVIDYKSKPGSGTRARVYLPVLEDK